ncbi:hypothetical protein UO65_0738 [Actinokineospora spheciospongiae]|uniref:Uncharacterized protein n=1 Tax=Actinokineospora spheciospongiae TaxID=909613 RepID=W7IU61_9PSEU|nr:hypothetical protein UO65_0738 [Actinokineospora spheciospongiae]PWW51915.1 hypothetical protein DFQ13_11910 [Actinokineospora spheciospongiae]
MLETDPNPIYTELSREQGVSPVPEQQDPPAEKIKPTKK